MISSDGKIHISFQEGFTENYINGFRETLGGEVIGNTFIVDKGPVKLKMSFYNMEGVEFSFTEIEAITSMVINRSPAYSPELLHLNIIKEGNFSQVYNEEITEVSSNALVGVFLYNGMFPIEAEFPPNTKIKLISFKFKPNEMGVIYDDLSGLFHDLFKGEKPLAYRSNLSPDNERLISDLFSFQKLSSGKVPLISARALEIFTNAGLHFKNKLEQDENLGLHISDYELLVEVKNKILNSLEAAFTIEELSNEFGVSSTKLKKNFKQLYGTTIFKFYNQARMDEAYRRLKTGKFSVSEVGYDLGYSNLSKFSAMFKKMKGLLPTEVIQTK